MQITGSYVHTRRLASYSPGFMGILVHDPDQPYEMLEPHRTQLFRDPNIPFELMKRIPVSVPVNFHVLGASTGETSTTYAMVYHHARGTNRGLEIVGIENNAEIHTIAKNVGMYLTPIERRPVNGLNPLTYLTREKDPRYPIGLLRHIVDHSPQSKWYKPKKELADRITFKNADMYDYMGRLHPKKGTHIFDLSNTASWALEQGFVEGKSERETTQMFSNNLAAFSQVLKKIGLVAKQTKEPTYIVLGRTEMEPGTPTTHLLHPLLQSLKFQQIYTSQVSTRVGTRDIGAIYQYDPPVNKKIHLVFP